jgi:hypothetical protein
MSPEPGENKMQVKKIENAEFHNANKLNGQAPRAKYGIFRGNVQVGVVLGSRVWDAWDMECKTRLVGFSCGSLKQLKEVLANK